ncbi:hypothetical protein BJ170DRAFT_616791 [Xylariales sp. AK1849]|nr:hypothetical protein BJ170DRAFT_616791 [Xylariales sp. AK1849]
MLFTKPVLLLLGLATTPGVLIAPASNLTIPSSTSPSSDEDMVINPLSGGCRTGKQPQLDDWHDVAKIAQCVETYKTIPNWGDASCGHHRIFMGGKLWKSPQKCIQSCGGCLKYGLNKGWSGVTCNAHAGAAHCWMGYCDERLTYYPKRGK